MVIFLQLLLFLIALVWRGRRLLGKHLSDYPGKAGRLRMRSESKGKVTALHLGIVTKGGTPFIVRKERFYHKFLKGIGIATEIRMHNQAFDDQYYFITDFPNHLERAMQSGPLMKALEALFALPVKSLHATPAASGV